MGAEAPDLRKFLGYKEKKPDQPEGVDVEAVGAENLPDNNEQVVNREVKNSSSAETALEAQMAPFDREAVLTDIIEKARKKGLEGKEAQIWIAESFFDAKRKHNLSNKEKEPKFKNLTEKYNKGAELWSRLKEHPYGKYATYLASESFITVPAVALGAHIGIIDNSIAVRKAASRIGMNTFIKSTVDFLLDKSKVLSLKNKIQGIFAKKKVEPNSTELKFNVANSDETETPIFETDEVSTAVPVFETSYSQNAPTFQSDVPNYQSFEINNDNSDMTPVPVFDNEQSEQKKIKKITPAMIRYGSMLASTGFVFLISGGTAAIASGGVSVAKEAAPALMKLFEKRVKKRIDRLIESKNLHTEMSQQEILAVLENTEAEYRKLEKSLGRMRWIRNYAETALDMGGCLTKWSVHADTSALSGLAHDAGNATGKAVKTVGKKVAKKIEKKQKSNL